MIMIIVIIIACLFIFYTLFLIILILKPRARLDTFFYRHSPCLFCLPPASGVCVFEWVCVRVCVCSSVCVLPYLRSRSKSRRDPKSSEYAPRLFSGILIANFTVSVCLSMCVCVCVQVRVCFKVLCFNENLHAECLIFALAPYLGVALPVPFPLPSPKGCNKDAK